MENQIDRRHLGWVIKWAMKGCSKDMEVLENDIIRYERFEGYPVHTKWGELSDTTRAQEAQSNLEKLNDLEKLWNWLVEAEKKLDEIGSKEFAAWFRERWKASKK